MPPRIVPVIARYLIYGASLGALTQLRAWTDPEGTAWRVMDRFVTACGKVIDVLQYLKPWGRLGEAHANTYDKVLGEELWEYMDEQVQGIRQS